MSEKVSMVDFKDDEIVKIGVKYPKGLSELCDRYKSSHDKIVAPRIRKSEVYLLLAELGLSEFNKKIIAMEGMIVDINKLKNV